MGHKVFVSYKYHDSDVRALPQPYFPRYPYHTTVRSYVDELQKILSITNHQNKGENDNEDLSGYSEDYIWKLLKDRIFDSSVTIVMVSPNMRERHKSDRSQWIPWEISFSLKETTRNDRTSHSNAVLAVVLPNRGGRYDYFLQWIQSGGLDRFLRSADGGIFPILKNNMFNRKKTYSCMHEGCYNESSYVKPVYWDEFIRNPNHYIEVAISIKEDAGCYNIQKEV